MKTNTKIISNEKENGRIYTPDYIVRLILDLAEYSGKTILKKHVMENSCGDGAFLCEIVRRYCHAAVSENMEPDEIRKDLSLYIHGIEIDAQERNKCLDKMNSVVAEFGVFNVDWDILCGDALRIHCYDGKMDFVLGNPPYVRVHNLATPLNEIKRYSFAQDGMTDMFIVFYEVGLRMLSKKGVLGYITPSSFFNSVAGARMRKVFVEHNLLKKIVNMKHYQAFSATTYTTIVILGKNSNNDHLEYYEFDAEKSKAKFVDYLGQNDFFINGNYYFALKEELAFLRKVFTNYGKSDVYVKNGYATLCDGVFIGDFEFDSPLVIPVVKSSKGTIQKTIYPYDKQAKLLPESAIKKDSSVYRYLLSNKETLMKRSNEKDSEKYWYAFGRSQALTDTYRDKLTINTLIRDENDLKFTSAPSGVGVYGGLYIVSDTVSKNEIIDVLKTKEFAVYVSLLSKYKSGGYYTFSSKDVKAYLDYKLSYDGGLFSC